MYMMWQLMRFVGVVSRSFSSSLVLVGYHLQTGVFAHTAFVICAFADLPSCVIFLLGNVCTYIYVLLINFKGDVDM